MVKVIFMHYVFAAPVYRRCKASKVAGWTFVADPDFWDEYYEYKL